MQHGVVVVKLGGSALTDKNLISSCAHDVSWLNSVGIKVLVVHGGGPHIEKHLKKLGIPVNFFEGTRITDSETLDVVEMVLAGRCGVNAFDSLRTAQVKVIAEVIEKKKDASSDHCFWDDDNEYSPKAESWWHWR